MAQKLFFVLVLILVLTFMVFTSVPQLLSYPDTVFNAVGVFGLLCYIYVCVFVFPKMFKWVFKTKE